MTRIISLLLVIALVGAQGTLPTQTSLIPSARAYNTTNESIANSTDQVVTFNTNRWDNDSIHSTSTNTSRFTMPVAGVYACTAQLSFAANATAQRFAILMLNGAGNFSGTILAVGGQNNAITASQPVHAQVSTQWKFAVGDYIEVYAEQSSSGSLNVTASADYSPEMECTYVSGG